MKILFLDIDGYTVKADIQKYVGKIELFGDDTIKDFEYIKKCIEFMLMEAKKNRASEGDITFIKNVYNYVSVNMFEMLKEHRDCFLEYDNLSSFEEKKEYYENYQKNAVMDLNNREIPKYMDYIIGSLKYARFLIEVEIEKAKLTGRNVKLPFETMNLDNDIISYDDTESPLKRAKSALNRMELYAMNRENGRDDFLTACSMIGDSQIVNYDEIYTKEHLVDGVVEGLKYLLGTKKVDMIIGCSHYTGSREDKAKNRLFAKELPFVLMLPESLLKFHIEPAQMGKRRTRSSKNYQIEIIKQRIAQVFRINPNEITAILGDDSFPNLEALENKIGILYRPRTKLEKESGVDNPTDERFIRQFSWDINELDYIFDKVSEKIDNNKVLKKEN